MEDGLIEIDPELYVKCRLCLIETGKFQILPKLQERIKFAFDIEVKLFDGFSQVLCEKCKTIVNDYSTIKEDFQSKQANLRSKCQEEKIEIDKSKESNEIGKNGVRTLTRKKKKTKKRKLKRIITSSSSEDECLNFSDEPTIVNEKLENKDTLANPNDASTSNIAVIPEKKDWQYYYKACYVCRYCNKILNDEESIKKHVIIHRNLIKKKRKLVPFHSTVKMQKFDSVSNFTNEDDVVVLNPKKLVSDAKNPDFYIIHSPIMSNETKDNVSITEWISSDTDDVSGVKKNFMCEDVVSDDSDLLRPKIRKRIKVQFDNPQASIACTGEAGPSGLNGNKNLNYDDNDCSAISDSTPSHLESEIYKLISASVANCKKKHDNFRNVHHQDDYDVLQKKLLSVGRRIMHKEGIVSLGLLKYLEQKNLKVNLIKVNPDQLNSKTGKYVRIQTKLSYPAKDVFCGFKPCMPDQGNCVTNQTEVNKQTNDMFRLNDNKNEIIVPLSSSNQIMPPFLTTLLTTVPSVNPLVVVSNISSHKTAVDTLVPNTNATLTLLNANPVANPKKVVKKKMSENVESSVSNEMIIVPTPPIVIPIEEFICLDSDQEDDSSSIKLKNDVTGMPIITSTESLANKDKNQPKENPGIPRIKCKPVSELMASTTDRVINNFPSVQNPTVILKDTLNKLAKNNLKLVKPPPPGTLILSSVSMPNTITNKPVQYFASLLTIHNLELVLVRNNQNFIRLVKYRMDANNGTSENMKLIIELNVHENKFLLYVQPFNISNLPAIRQWDILLGLRHDDAVKNIIKTAHEDPRIIKSNVQLFLNLLKSIAVVDGPKNI